jgi:hypothetical protein
MDPKAVQIINLTESLIKDIETKVPPAVELLEDLKMLIASVRKEHGLPEFVIAANPGTA